MGFSAAIAELAARYHCPGFAPHVTLASGGEALAEAFEQLGTQQPVLRVQPTGLAHGATYFQHLSVPLAPGAILQQSRDDAAQRCGLPATIWRPHLSLLYRPPSQRDTSGYTRTLRGLSADGLFRLAPFALDHLALIRLAEHPCEWRTLNRTALR
jgi:hypothetical protein